MGEAAATAVRRSTPAPGAKSGSVGSGIAGRLGSRGVCVEACGVLRPATRAEACAMSWALGCVRLACWQQHHAEQPSVCVRCRSLPT